MMIWSPHVRELDFCRETLELAGVEQERVLISEAKDFVKGYSDFAWIEKSNRFFGQPTKQEVDLLSELFAPHLKDPSSLSEILIINRIGYRTYLYLEDFVKLLSAKGFRVKIVFLEKLSVLEQLRLFAQAKIIVSIHGAGLTNLIAIRPGTYVFELFNPTYRPTMYQAITEYRQGLYESFYDLKDCSPEQEHLQQKNVSVDPYALASKVFNAQSC